MGILDDIMGTISGAASDVGGAVTGIPGALGSAYDSVASSLSDPIAALEGVPKQAEQWGKDVWGAVSGIPSAVGLGGSSTPSNWGLPGSTTTPGMGTFQMPPTDPYQQVIASTVGTSDTAFNQLFGEYAKGLANLAPSTSGQTTSADIGKATALGQSIGGSGVQGQNPAYASALNADASAWNTANNQGQQGVMAALGDVRQADEQYLGVAPYMAKLQALLSGAQYRAETNTGTSGAAYNTTGDPQFLQNAYANSQPAFAAGGPSTPGATPTPAAPANPKVTPSSSTPDSLGQTG